MDYAGGESAVHKLVGHSPPYKTDMLIEFIAIVVGVLVVIAAANVLIVQRRRLAIGPIRDLEVLTRHLDQDVVLITKTTAATRSHFGGIPNLPQDIAWPSCHDRPLAFLACIDCSELPRSNSLNWLPNSGQLLFFYDVENQPWGFDPKDRASWATIYVAVDDISGTSRVVPSMVVPDECQLPKRNITFNLTRMPPSSETEELKSLGLTDAEWDEFWEMRAGLYGDQPHHQIGGFPDPIQDPEMQLECELASHGLYCGDSSGYNDPLAKQLKESANDWSLLFQMDSDGDLNVMWGDAGIIYFWVRRDEARRRQFDGTWLVLQCS